MLVLYRYRNRVLCLDSVQALTRGVPQGLFGPFDLLKPHARAYTALAKAGKGRPVIGQIRILNSASLARITFLLPVDGLDSMVLPGLLEHLAFQAGARGALHFIAEVDEDSCVFEALRRAGFSAYAWQHTWKFPSPETMARPSLDGHRNNWRSFRRSTDLPGVRALYQSLVPALVQPIDLPPGKHSKGLIYQRGNDLQAYIDLAFGPLGVWAQPFIHPATENVYNLLAELLTVIPHPGKRPVYLCVRSYQSWFESAIGELGAESGPPQALMVKHLAISQRVHQVLRIPGLEKGRAEPAAPVVNLTNNDHRQSRPCQ